MKFGKRRITEWKNAAIERIIDQADTNKRIKTARRFKKKKRALQKAVENRKGGQLIAEKVNDSKYGRNIWRTLSQRKTKTYNAQKYGMIWNIKVWHKVGPGQANRN